MRERGRKKERENGRARKGRASVEGRRRDAARYARDREGKGRTARHAHTRSTEQSLCVISDACAPRRPNLQSSSYTSSSDRISTRFFHQLLDSIRVRTVYICTVEAEAPISLLLAFPIFFDFLFPALLLAALTCVFFFFYYRGNQRGNGTEGGGRVEGGLRVWIIFFLFPHLNLNEGGFCGFLGGLRAETFECCTNAVSSHAFDTRGGKSLQFS